MRHNQQFRHVVCVVSHEAIGLGQILKDHSENWNRDEMSWPHCLSTLLQFQLGLRDQLNLQNCGAGHSHAKRNLPNPTAEIPPFHLFFIPMVLLQTKKAADRRYIIPKLLVKRFQWKRWAHEIASRSIALQVSVMNCKPSTRACRCGRRHLNRWISSPVQSFYPSTQNGNAISIWGRRQFAFSSHALSFSMWSTAMMTTPTCRVICWRSSNHSTPFIIGLSW